MEADSNSSETNLVITNRKYRLKVFCKLYWRILVLILAPLGLLPIAFQGEKNAYKCFYIFLVTAAYWLGDVFHPSMVALVPIALYTLMGSTNQDFLSGIYVRNGVLDCLGMMMIIAAIEESKVQKRVALKLLLIFGCSHYRMSFLLFFSCMFLSMWVPNTMACGLMVPLLRTVLTELEKMGILEVHQTIGKAIPKSNRHEQNVPRPTDFTVFYFLGIAYSSSIGGMATLNGSQTNYIFKENCEKIFPLGPKIEYPHYMLLNLPGVLLIETLLYLWMNFYFLGMFRAQSEIALEIGISQEEAQYIQTLLSTQYHQLGKPKLQETIVGGLVISTVLFQAMSNTSRTHVNVSSPSILCVILMFVTPTNLNFMQFFRHPGVHEDRLPDAPSKACLNWNSVNSSVHWSIVLLICGSCQTFDALQASGMTDELEKFLLLFQQWPAPALALVVIIFSKLFTEFASNSCVAHTLLPSIARLSVVSKVHPHYLMLSATLACSMPFHLITGTPPNAMVAAYVHIPPWKMMHAGIGPSVIAVVVVWFTVTLWSKVIWTDINVYPEWADMAVFNKNITL